MSSEHSFVQGREADTPNPTAEQPEESPPVEESVGLVRCLELSLGKLLEARSGRVGRAEREQACGLLTRIESVARSLKCGLAEDLTEEGVSESDVVELMRRAGRMPEREARRLVKTSKQLPAMPEVRKRFAVGDITTAHADALAIAAEKVGPEAVNDDPDLLDTAGRMLVDSYGRRTRRWTSRTLIESGVDPLEGQRRQREAKMWVERGTGLGVIHAKLPRPQYEHLRQAVDHHYMHHLRQDVTRGAGNGDTADGGRTPKQRLADALYELVTNRDAHTGETLTDTAPIRAKAATQLILTAQTGVIDGTDPHGQVRIADGDPVPRHILTTLSPDTEIAVLLFDRQGRPLWLGKSQRLANAAQRLAVAIRDGGCFECGAPMHRCELHHIQEWHRDDGRTDIDNLVAVCRRHHRQLQTDNLQVVRTADGYETRPRTDQNPPSRTLEPD